MNLLQTLFGFQGRIGRGPFWLTALALILIDAAVLLAAQEHLDGAGGRSGPIAAGGALVVLALSVWAGLALKVKRLHDRGRSGLHLLAALIPIAGWLWLLWEIGLAPGRRSGARFDPHPAEEDDSRAEAASVACEGDGEAGLGGA